MSIHTQLIINYLKQHGITIRTLHGELLSLSVNDYHINNGTIQIFHDHIKLIPNPRSNQDSGLEDLVLQINNADPQLYSKLDHYIHHIKNICPLCGRPGPPTVCNDCKGQETTEYTNDMRQSRGY